MADTFPPAKQRSALLAFAEACCTRSDKLRRDECGNWCIFGKQGHVFAVPDGGYQLLVFRQSAQRWTYAKRRLSFAEPTQDGDEEGAVILNRLPAKIEASEIRAVLGIPKRVEYSEETLTAKRFVVDPRGLSITTIPEN
jgi:hypothetical protein